MQGDPAEEGGGGTGAVQEGLFTEGMHESQPDVRCGRWKAYRTAASVKELTAWLHSNGTRERELRRRLQAVHSDMLASARLEDAAAADAAANADGDAVANVKGQDEGAEVGGGEEAGGEAAGSARELGKVLLQMEASLPAAAALPAAASEPRRAAWRRLVASATGLPLEGDEREEEKKPAVEAVTGVALRPEAAMAALLLLEAMVRTQWLRPFWRLWSLPLPEPARTRTWAAVWHRALHLSGALRCGGRSGPSARELAAFQPRPAARTTQPAAASETESEGAGGDIAAAPPARRRRMAADLDLSVIDYSGRGRRCRAGRVNYAETAGEIGLSESSDDGASRGASARDTRAARAARRWGDAEGSPKPRGGRARMTRAAAREQVEDALGLSGRERRAQRRGGDAGGAHARGRAESEDDGSEDGGDSNGGGDGDEDGDEGAGGSFEREDGEGGGGDEGAGDSDDGAGGGEGSSSDDDDDDDFGKPVQRK